MESPNFSNAEFINQTIWNNGVTQLVSGIHAFAGNNVFFQSGLLNPSSAGFVFPGNLTVEVNLPSPFTVLFGSGAYCGAHGVINGQDISAYVVDFTAYVPVTGSQIVYLGITYGGVMQDPYVIIGPPVGHPDYSANFEPVVGYATSEETLILTPTITPPDNQTVIELARVTLTAGQTAITSLDTTHQQLASLIISSLRLAGDVVGNFNDNIIQSLQTYRVEAITPAPDTYLYFNGSVWLPAKVTLPTTLPPDGPAGGDLGDDYPNPIVVGVEGIPINPAQPLPTVTGQTLVYDKPSNQYNWINMTTVGSVYGPYGLPGNNPVTLGPNQGPSNNGLVPVTNSISIPLPSVPVGAGGWRLAVAYTAAVDLPGGGRISCFIGDDNFDPTAPNFSEAFCFGMQDFVIDTAFVQGFDFSSFYAGGTNVTITLYVAAAKSGHCEPSVISNGVVTVFTGLTIFVIPALA